MKLSDGEKLILIMLGEIYEKLQLDGEIDPKFIKSAIYSKNTWGIRWKYDDIPFEDSDNPEMVKDVIEILDMWSFIEDSYENLSEKDKLLVEKEAVPFGKYSKFPGFHDPTEIEQKDIAMFLINDLDRFKEFKDRDLKSPIPSFHQYRRMYTVFDQMLSAELFRDDFMNAEQLIQILREKFGPRTDKDYYI